MPPKGKGKKRPRTTASPEDDVDQDRKDEIVMTFQHALKKEGEKSLSISKVKKCLRNLGLEAKSEEIQSFFGDNDDENPVVVESLDEASFLRFAAIKALQTDKAHKAFELMDQDGKGVVVIEDLQRVALELGEDMSREELEEMVELADQSGDGLLTAQDFIRIARKVNL